MSSNTPPAAPPFKKGRKPEKPEVMTDSVQATNEELRSKLMDVQVELQQERGKVRGRLHVYKKSMVYHGYFVYLSVSRCDFSPHLIVLHPKPYVIYRQMDVVNWTHMDKCVFCPGM